MIELSDSGQKPFGTSLSEDKVISLMSRLTMRKIENISSFLSENSRTGNSWVLVTLPREVQSDSGPYRSIPNRASRPYIARVQLGNYDKNADTVRIIGSREYYTFNEHGDAVMVKTFVTHPLTVTQFDVSTLVSFYEDDQEKFPSKLRGTQSP